jgi:putative membrane protein
MWIRALVASTHYLALALGFWSLMERGRAVRALIGSKNLELDAKRVFFYDNFWGMAALLWIGTGLLRAFGGLEKGTAYYISNDLFWTKLSLFAVVFLLELSPMITFIRWRKAIRKKLHLSISEGHLKTLSRINTVEILLVILIVFIAGLMARGVGL